MSRPNTIEGDLTVIGNVTVLGGVSLPAGSITNPNIKPGATGTYVEATKSEQMHRRAVDLNGSSTATAAAARRVLHVVRGTTATLDEFAVGAVTAALGNATVTLDLKVNGTTVLSSTITLDNTTAAFALKNPAGYTSQDLVRGDVVEAQITAVNAGTGTLPAGVFASLQVTEDPQ